MEAYQDSSKYKVPFFFLSLSHSYLIIFTGSTKQTTQLNQPVFLYLFNDSIALVYKKKALLGGKTKLILDKLFIWHQTAIIDVKDAEHKNTIKVMRYPDTFVYKTDNADDKRIFMANVKLAMDELALNKKKEGLLNAQKNLDSTFSMGHLTGENTEYLDDEEDEEDEFRLERSKDVIKEVQEKCVIPEKESRFINDLADELDVLIAYR